MTYFDKTVTLADNFSADKSKTKKEELYNILSIIKQGLIEVDALGLLLLGFGFALLLLPFSLAGSADNGWRTQV